MFKSFFMAGFECATGENAKHEPIDQIAATQHDRHLVEDYRRLRDLDIHVVREGLRWPTIDRGNGYSLDELDLVVDAAQECGHQLILDLFHYGYPDELDIFSEGFVARFESYCYEVALRVKSRSTDTTYFTAVNEPSYFAWAAGDASLFRPHESGRSFELKVQLAKAAIAGMKAILRVSPEARFVNVDPICRVAPRFNQPESTVVADEFNENVVFQSWDMIAGRLLPELGGNERLLDIVGLNYYWTNQWEHENPGSPLLESDERCWPLRDLLRWVWLRYRHELLISETAHVNDERGPWIRRAAGEAEAVLNEGIPLRGICLYPVLGMPEWHQQDAWTRMGLWDLQPESGRLERVPHSESIDALRWGQGLLEGLNLDGSLKPKREIALPYLA